MSSTESVQINRIYISDTLVKIKVNQSQLNDNNYGTRENLIPIFCIEVPERKNSQNYYIVDKTEEQYEEKVYYYLAYIMPKVEFKELFESTD